MFTHTSIYTHIHSVTHRHFHTHIHPHSEIQTKYIMGQVHPSIMSCSYSCSPHSEMHSHTTVYPQTQLDIYMNAAIYLCTQPFVHIFKGVHPPSHTHIYNQMCTHRQTHKAYFHAQNMCIHTLSPTHTISSPYTSVTIYTNISLIRCRPVGLSTDNMYSNMHTKT